MKKTIIALLFSLYASCLVFSQAVNETSQEVKMQVFVDDLGRRVVLPENITRIAPSGSNAQVIVFQVAPDKLVGLSDKLSTAEKEIYPQYTHNLPAFGTLYGKKANLNKEELILANPEVLIDVGEIKGSAADMAKELDRVSSDIGIPVIFIEADMDNYNDVFRKLGRLFKREERAEQLALFYENAVSEIERYASGKKPGVYITSSNDGLSAVINGTSHAQCARKAGADVVVTSKLAQANGSISLETLYQLDPDYIFAYTDEGYRTITTEKNWSTLSAVQNNRVFLVPSVPHYFIDSPVCSNRIIGLYYLASIFYPQAGIDIVAKTREFYSLFYGKDLDDSQVRQILRMD